MKILIDNGHGRETAGKRCPDGRLREYSWAREIASLVVAGLRSRGIDAERIVPEDSDIHLGERVRRVNARCNEVGAGNVLLISIHCNAAGDGVAWRSAGGWSAYTSPGHTEADELASCLYEAARTELSDYIRDFPVNVGLGRYDGRQRPLRTDFSDGDPDLEARFRILCDTLCPAVLTESMFQDNRSDVDFLLSEAGKRHIADLHVNGVVEYLKRKRV